MTSTTPEARMYDALTLDNLYRLHASLCKTASRIHTTMMDGQHCLISPLSDEWAVKSAALRELNETENAVFAEITRRQVELVGELLTHVAMVCTACRKPAVEADESTEGARWWIHETADDSRKCPRDDRKPVTVMVAAGNESVPGA